ncbi:hypothetical protein A1O7_05858 [Cladophialophora yegresii CBS 114405]|uniref:Uncharacterized protein n=1 Tax=Cladophialophora yegresii CBS 114405 TaxID=1182544 RepID=W9VSA8_9EURO|nr:uncharacterized protein A1O7_05858 [Cladophialophora yegresii CBS 114405]EXJ58433.1 hypothetical protein A1O7_05858 [Cladophialophora yegresii CBS 114405]
MKILIIPYDGGNQSQAKASEDGVTRTQHAAREYHRNAKLRKARTKARATEGGDQRQRKAKKTGGSTGSPETEDGEKLPVRQQQQQSSLHTLLGVSRADPFKTGCSSDVPVYVHEMLDHAISYQWSEFRLSDDGAGLNAPKAEIMQSVMKSPQAWYAVIFAGATHDAYQHGAFGAPKQNEQLRLYYKTKAIEALLEDIAQNADMVSEETLLSMIVLASHGTGEKLRGADSAKRRDLRLPFVPHVHGVEYYSAMDTGSEHLNAVYSLVDKRGGLRSIRLRSLAICIQLYDIYASWKKLQSPHFDLLAPTAYAISLRAHKSDAVACDLLGEHANGFHALLSIYSTLDHLVEIAEHASIFSADFDQLIRCYSLPKEQRCQGKMPNIALVKFTRWCVLHDILTLPAPASEADHVLELEEHTISEICRLILLAYAVFAIVPMLPESKIHERLADKIERVLHDAVELAIPARHPELFLCVVGWGFMCAHKAVRSGKLGKLLRSFVAFLEYQDVVKLQADEWPAVADVMKSFLWLDAYCEEPGQKFWACACGLAQKYFTRD